MPQEIHVVRCCSCRVYQTDIVKKSSKWTCKLCGITQTIRIIFGKGSGKECRLHAQKLNDTNRSYNMIFEKENDRRQGENTCLEFDEENLDSVTNDRCTTHNITSIGQDVSIESSCSNGNYSSFTESTKESSMCRASSDESSGSHILTVSKKRKLAEAAVFNGNSKWSRLLPTESDSDSEEHAHISYVQNQEEIVLSGARRKNIFGDVGIDNLFADS